MQGLYGVKVAGIGNVTSCNRSYIFLNDEGRQSSLKSNEKRLEIIREVALRDYEFFSRMYEELQENYDKRKAVVESRYHFISEDMVKEAFNKDRKEGLRLSWEKDSNNEECIRQYGKLSGISEIAGEINDKKWNAYRVYKQAESSLQKK